MFKTLLLASLSAFLCLATACDGSTVAAPEVAPIIGAPTPSNASITTAAQCVAAGGYCDNFRGCRATEDIAGTCRYTSSGAEVCCL